MTEVNVARSERLEVDADAELRWTVRHAAEGSPFFRDHFAAAGVRPDEVRGLADLPGLPFTTKQDLRDHGPWGLTAVPLRDVVRIHSSSGTTGQRTICTYSAADVEAWTQQFARCYAYAGVGPEDRVQIAVGYGLWTAGVGFQAGAERVGAMAVPAGPGNTALQVELLTELQSTVLGATASFALLLAELTSERGLGDQLALRVGIFGSERWGETTRRAIERGLGITSYDVYGLTELWGPGTGIECSAHDGMHVWADHYHVEIVDPETLAPLPDGEEGEIVLTTFRKEAAPLVRYRTRDLSRRIPGPCSCGSPHPRIARLTGRTDDAVKVRGVLLLPAQVDHVLDGLGEAVSGEYQVHVDRDEAGRDALLVKIESEQPSVASAVADRLRKLVGLRCDVEVLAPGTLGRTERKTRRVYDHRDV